jgi:hypothetical protein
VSSCVVFRTVLSTCWELTRLSIPTLYASAHWARVQSDSQLMWIGLYTYINIPNVRTHVACTPYAWAYVYVPVCAIFYLLRLVVWHSQHQTFKVVEKSYSRYLSIRTPDLERLQYIYQESAFKCFVCLMRKIFQTRYLRIYIYI